MATTLRINPLLQALVAIAALMLSVVLTLALASGPAAAQSSGGCPGGPFDGATALDSDGDGVSDGDEIVAGTDECDPNSTPSNVCGRYVANYDPTTADTDADGHSDADEVLAGTDPCDSTSVISSTATTAPPVTTTQGAPTLALTGPSTALIGVLVGLAAVFLGLASLAIGRRVDA